MNIDHDDANPALTEGPAQKKLKDNVEWRITFDQTQGVRTLIDVVGGILQRINLRVKYDERRKVHFLCIDSIDPSHICMIQARLLCEKTHNLTEDVSFCVEEKIFNLIMKHIPNHYSVDFEKRRDSADIHVRGYETLSNSHQTHFEMRTLVDDGEIMHLNDIEYKHQIEMDLSLLRQIVKMSKSLNSEQLEFIVKKPKNDENERILRTVFTIASRGDAVQSHKFYSATVAENPRDKEGPCIIRAATDSTGPECEDEADMAVVYSDAFANEYLSNFLKNMERQIITMKLSQDKPLIVHYPLGADKSYICFVLAPKTADD